MKRRALVWIAASLALVSTACGPTPSSAPSQVASLEPSEGSAANPCAGQVIRGPDGTTVDLTGTWRGFASGSMYVTQTGSCIAIEGLSDYPDEPAGTQWRSVFTGDLTADLTIVGRFTWTHWVAEPEVSSGDTWNLSMRLDFDEESHPVIVIAARDVGLPYGPAYDLSLERVSLSTAYPD